MVGRLKEQIVAGYPDIGDHGLIGDLQTAALVTTDGVLVAVAGYVTTSARARASAAAVAEGAERDPGLRDFLGIRSSADSPHLGDTSRPRDVEVWLGKRYAA